MASRGHGLSPLTTTDSPMSDDLVFDQTYTYEGTHYRAGRPMPREVAEGLGLVEAEEGAADDAEDPDSGDDDTPLPEGFPVSDKLYEAGLRTVEAIDEAPDETLDAIEGVGPATIENIRDAVTDALS